jgi:hypothetical protein
MEKKRHLANDLFGEGAEVTLPEVQLEIQTVDTELTMLRTALGITQDLINNLGPVVMPVPNPAPPAYAQYIELVGKAVSEQNKISKLQAKSVALKELERLLHGERLGLASLGFNKATQAQAMVNADVALTQLHIQLQQAGAPVPQAVIDALVSIESGIGGVLGGPAVADRVRQEAQDNPDFDPGRIPEMVAGHRAMTMMDQSYFGRKDFMQVEVEDGDLEEEEEGDGEVNLGLINAFIAKVNDFGRRMTHFPLKPLEIYPDRPPLDQPVESNELDEDILEAMVMNGLLRRAKPRSYGKIFTITQKNKLRLIYDPYRLNEVIAKPSFRLPGLIAMRNCAVGGQLAVMDLEFGYWQVPVHESSQHWLGIRVRGIDYVWSVLPFGLAIAPYYFQWVLRKPLKEIFQKFPTLNYIRYLDDILISSSDGKTKLLDVLNEFEKRHICVNWKKSSKQWEKEIKYLGYLLSSTGLRIAPKDIEDLGKLKETVKTSGDLSLIIGKFIFLSKPFLEIRGLASKWRKALPKEYFYDHDKTLLIEKKLPDLHLLLYEKKLNWAMPKDNIIVWTDASDFMYAIVSMSGLVSKKLPTSMMKSPSVVREVYAVWRLVKLAPANVGLWIIMDNLPVMLSLLKGYSKGPLLGKYINRIMKKILEKNIYIYPLWVPSGCNLADAPSRKLYKNQNFKWERETFKMKTFLSPATHPSAYYTRMVRNALYRESKVLEGKMADEDEVATRVRERTLVTRRRLWEAEQGLLEVGDGLPVEPARPPQREVRSDLAGSAGFGPRDSRLGDLLVDD